MTLTLWVVWNPDGGDEGPDDGHKFRAIDAQDAAQQWGHRVESYGCEDCLRRIAPGDLPSASPS